MITKAVQSSKFGESGIMTTDGKSLRLMRLTRVEALGVQLQGGTRDEAGNIYFDIPDDKLDEFNELVDSFENDIRFCW